MPLTSAVMIPWQSASVDPQRWTLGGRMRTGPRELAVQMARRVRASNTAAGVRNALTINPKTQNKGRLRTPTTKVITGIFVCSAGLMLVGTFFLWPRLAGVPARMTVTNCFQYTGKGDVCFGMVPPNGKTIEILGTDSKDIGHDIDVHTTGSSASADKYWGFFVYSAVGVFLAGAGVFAVVLRRRRLSAERRGPPSA